MYANHTFHASAERTGSGAYVVVGIVEAPCGLMGEGTFFLDVTAIEAVTTLDAKIQSQDLISLKWFDLVAFTQLGAVGQERKAVVANLGAKLRATYSITNLKKATFTISVTLKD